MFCLIYGCVPGAHRGQKRALGPRALESVMSCHVGPLERQLFFNHTKPTKDFILLQLSRGLRKHFFSVLFLFLSKRSLTISFTNILS